MVHHRTFPQGAPVASQSQGGARFAEFENLLFHNYSTTLANPTLWYVTFDKLPKCLNSAGNGEGMTGEQTTDSNIINREGPNLYRQLPENLINLHTVMENTREGCMVIHGVTLPELSVEAGRDDSRMGGYYGGMTASTVKEQNQLQIEIRESQSSILEFLIRPWIEAVAKNGFIARPEGDSRNVKTRITVIKLGVAGPGTDPLIRKSWEFYDCAPTSLANHRLAHDGTWSAADMFIQTSWVYSHYKIADIHIDNIKDVYASHVSSMETRATSDQRTSGRVGDNSAPAGMINVVTPKQS